MKQTFYFNTGVKRWNNDYMAEGDIWVNNERHIVFYCEGVPAGATFQFAGVYGDIPEYDHLLVFPIIGGNMVSTFAYFNPPPKPKIQFTHSKQWFSFTWNDKKYYFEAALNGEGVYSEGSVLGALYDEWGMKIEVKRVSFSLLTPLNYSEISRVFDII